MIIFICRPGAAKMKSSISLKCRKQANTGFWPGGPQSSANTASAKYIVNHADGSSVLFVDQSTDGGQWNEIGEYLLSGRSLFRYYQRSGRTRARSWPTGSGLWR